MSPNSLRNVRQRRLRWRRGENLALFVSKLLEFFLKPLPPPFAGVGSHLTFDLDQTPQRRFRGIHRRSVFSWLWLLSVTNRYPPNLKNCVKMHPEVEISGFYV